MTGEQIQALTYNAKRVLRGRDREFLYCPAGPNGMPVLIIDRRIRDQRRALRKTARKKVFVSGEVGNHDGKLEFRTEKPLDKFKKDLKLRLGKYSPHLRRAQVISMEEYETREIR